MTEILYLPVVRLVVLFFLVPSTPGPGPLKTSKDASLLETDTLPDSKEKVRPDSEDEEGSETPRTSGRGGEVRGRDECVPRALQGGVATTTTGTTPVTPLPGPLDLK